MVLLAIRDEFLLSECLEILLVSSEDDSVPSSGVVENRRQSSGGGLSGVTVRCVVFVGTSQNLVHAARSGEDCHVCVFFL